MTERSERELPFEIEADGKIVLVHRFRPDLDQYFGGYDRELPILKRSRFDEMFGIYETIEGARSAMTKGPAGEAMG